MSTAIAASARVIAESLGGSPLSVAVQARTLPEDLRPWWPERLEQWRQHAQRVSAAATTDWYGKIAAAISATGNARERIERVAAAGGVLVTTGQQPGLFGGPLYTITKALSALALADAIEQTLGIPTAPLFWAATDDADFAEASLCHIATTDGLIELRLGQANPELAGAPMSDTPLGDTRALIRQLRSACGSAPHAQYLEHAAVAYTERRTVGDAYVDLLRRVLEPLGIAVLDASHSTCREAARPLLREALERAARIAQFVGERTRALRDARHEPQVEDERGLSLVFALDGPLKRRIEIAKAARFSQSSVPLSPNVLLRPVVERELVPTVGYVAGPAELAYFAQANAVASALDRQPLVAVPRWSCTVIETFVDKALRRLGIEYADLRDAPGVERRLARSTLPPTVAEAWNELQSKLRESMGDLGRAVEGSRLLPPTVIQGLERSLAHRLSRAERRLLAAVKRREEHTRRDLTLVKAALFPRGKRQERVLSFLPMLTRGGAELTRKLIRGAREHADALVGIEKTQPAGAG